MIYPRIRASARKIDGVVEGVTSRLDAGKSAHRDRARARSGYRRTPCFPPALLDEDEVLLITGAPPVESVVTTEIRDRAASPFWPAAWYRHVKPTQPRSRFARSSGNNGRTSVISLSNSDRVTSCTPVAACASSGGSGSGAGRSGGTCASCVAICAREPVMDTPMCKRSARPPTSTSVLTI